MTRRVAFSLALALGVVLCPASMVLLGAAAPVALSGLVPTQTGNCSQPSGICSAGRFQGAAPDGGIAYQGRGARLAGVGWALNGDEAVPLDQAESIAGGGAILPDGGIRCPMRVVNVSDGGVPLLVDCAGNAVASASFAAPLVAGGVVDAGVLQVRAAATIGPGVDGGAVFTVSPRPDGGSLFECKEQASHDCVGYGNFTINGDFAFQVIGKTLEGAGFGCQGPGCYMFIESADNTFIEARDGGFYFSSGAYFDGTQGVTATKFVGPATALKSATTSVDVASATAPSIGQVLTAGGANSASWVTPTSGTVTGTGAANQIAYWTSSSAIAGDTGLTYNAGTDTLTAGLFSGPVTDLKSATTTVNVSSATAPSAGQILTATDSTHATWQSAAASGAPMYTVSTVNVNPSWGAGTFVLSQWLQKGNAAIHTGRGWIQVAGNSSGAESFYCQVYDETDSSIVMNTASRPCTTAAGSFACQSSDGSEALINTHIYSMRLVTDCTLTAPLVSFTITAQ